MLAIDTGVKLGLLPWQQRYLFTSPWAVVHTAVEEETDPIGAGTLERKKGKFDFPTPSA